MPTLPTPPTTPPTATALASPSSLEALVAGVKAGARCRDGGAQAAAAAVTSLAATITASPSLPLSTHPHLAALLSFPPSHPHRSVRVAALDATAALASAVARHDPALAATSALPAFTAGGGDAAPEVREAAVRAAGGVVAATAATAGSTSTPLTLAPLLLAGATDSDAGVARAAVAGLGLSPPPPCRAWQAWARWGAAADLPCTRPLAAAAGSPHPLLPPSALQPLLAARLTPRALWGLVCLAGPVSLGEHAGQVVAALEAAVGGGDDPTATAFAAQSAGAALGGAAFVAGATTMTTTCLLYGCVAAGHSLGQHALTTATAALEGWWERAEAGGAAAATAAAWPALQAAGLAARAASPESRPAVAHRLWCLAVREAAAVGGGGGGGGGASAGAVARLLADLGCTAAAAVPPAWGATAVASLLSSATPPPLPSLEAVLVAMGSGGGQTLPRSALTAVLDWAEAHAGGLEPPGRRALLRLVGAVAASPGGAAALGEAVGGKDAARTSADRVATAILLPCLTQPKVGGGGVRAAAAVATEMIAHLLASAEVASSLTSALAARATADVDPTARAAACGGLGAVMAARGGGGLSQAAWEEGVAALATAADDAGDGAGSAAVRGAAGAAVEALCAAVGDVEAAGVCKAFEGWRG